MKNSQLDPAGLGYPTEPRQRDFIPLFRLLALLIVVGALGGLAYVLLRNTAFTGGAKPDARVAEFREQLEKIEKRLDQLEKRRKVSLEPATPRAAADTPSSKSSTPSSARRASITFFPPQTTLGHPATQSPRDPGVTDLQQGLGSLRRDVEANQESWKATTDRLSDVIGELGDQRKELEAEQDRVLQLLKRSDRDLVRFELQRGGKGFPVGPVLLKLKAADERTQRYTVHVFVDHKWVEIKDRPLFEGIELYAVGATNPLELVVTKVLRDQVVGYLAVPTEKTNP